MKNSNDTINQAPPWLMHALKPFIARSIARNMVKKYPGLGRDAILHKMRTSETSMQEYRATMQANQEQVEQMLERVGRYLPVHGDNPATTDKTKPVHWYSPSSLVLIGANLIPLYGVFELGWPIFPILFLFWLENVVIGLLNVLRMLLADPADLVLWTSKFFMVPFFCVHYGMFTAIHGLFVIRLFGGNHYGDMDHGFWPINGAIQAIRDFDLSWAVMILAASHLFSFLWNYLGHGEYRRAAISELMQRPYRRVVLLHLTILLGGAVAMALGSPVWGLLLLIALKIGFDLKAHIKEHRKALA
ncbi:MAG: DUF6498-containing protein [Gammaproteobacteria bacterium]|jgi:hypothetical protein